MKLLFQRIKNGFETLIRWLVMLFMKLVFQFFRGNVGYIYGLISERYEIICYNNCKYHQKICIQSSKVCQKTRPCASYAMLWSTSSMVEVVDAGKCNCVMREQISIEWKRVIWRKKIVALLIRCLSFYSKIQQDHEIAKECSSFLRRNIGVIPLKWGNTKLKIVC